jgi:hypothetical protein
MITQEIQEELTRSIKLSKTNTMTSTEFSVGASDRANKILAFDTNGELAVTQELGTNRGNWSSGVTFNARDIVKDSSNNNVYLCNTTHTSTGSTPISSNTDVAKWDLIVDAQSATNSANAASNHASNSSNFANNSSNSANTSANHSANSSNFANNASNSASNAANSEASVSANANASANSASNASNFANNSSNSANSASNHSSNSSNFANNSSNSANTSANHASNSSNFANNSSNSANTSSNHSANSSNFANNSSNHAANSSNFANASSNHASNSSNHSANSSNFANTSSNHASNSSNFSNNSSNFANTASNSANAANSARDAALAAADNFDDVYLGSKTADPTLDNDGDALTAGDLYYNSVGTVLKYYTGSAWVSITSGGITDLVQDTTPQLGGMLDVNGQSIGDGTLELVKFAETASAVNEITVTNSATGNAPEIAATGDDTNIDLKLTPKGTGKLNLDGIKFPNADGSAGQFLKTDGSGVLSFATVQSPSGFRNIVINGDMQIAQRSTSVASITTTGYYTLDRWYLGFDSLGTWTMSQSTDVPSGYGFGKSLKLDCTTADASPAGGDYMVLAQRFEGQNLQYLKKGTANAVSLTLSFWVKSTKTGTFICELNDFDNSRSISKSYTVNTTNTWEFKTITFAGDTTGAFDNDNAASVEINWFLGNGSNTTSGTLQTSWGTRTAANIAVGQVNIADNTANDFLITGVQLEAGTSATDFEFLPIDVSLGRCQRYYQLIASGSGINLSMGANYSSTELLGMVYLPTSMRTTPTISQVTGTDYYIFYRNNGSDTFNSIQLNLSFSTQIINFNNGAQISGTAGDSGLIATNNAASFVAVTAEL